MQTLGLSDSTPKPSSRIKDLFRPDLSSMQTARWACESGATACFAIAAITAAVAFFTDLFVLVDAALFCGIAIGLRYMSRTAAFAGLLLYIGEMAVNLMNGRFPGVISF